MAIGGANTAKRRSKTAPTPGIYMYTRININLCPYTLLLIREQEFLTQNSMCIYDVLIWII